MAALSKVPAKTPSQPKGSVAPAAPRDEAAELKAHLTQLGSDMRALHASNASAPLTLSPVVALRVLRSVRFLSETPERLAIARTQVPIGWTHAYASAQKVLDRSLAELLAGNGTPRRVFGEGESRALGVRFGDVAARVATAGDGNAAKAALAALAERTTPPNVRDVQYRIVHEVATLATFALPAALPEAPRRRARGGSSPTDIVEPRATAKRSDAPRLVKPSASVAPQVPQASTPRPGQSPDLFTVVERLILGDRRKP